MTHSSTRGRMRSAYVFLFLWDTTEAGYACGEKQEGANEGQEGIDGRSQDVERYGEQPYDWPQYEDEQRDGPTDDEEQEPEYEVSESRHKGSPVRASASDWAFIGLLHAGMLHYSRSGQATRFCD
jgi:hypothetical protein